MTPCCRPRRGARLKGRFGIKQCVPSSQQCRIYHICHTSVVFLAVLVSRSVTLALPTTARRQPATLGIATGMRPSVYFLVGGLILAFGTPPAVPDFSKSKGSDSHGGQQLSPIHYQYIPVWLLYTDLLEVLRTLLATVQNNVRVAVRLGYIAPRSELTLFSA